MVLYVFCLWVFALRSEHPQTILFVERWWIDDTPLSSSIIRPPSFMIRRCRRSSFVLRRS